VLGWVANYAGASVRAGESRQLSVFVRHTDKMLALGAQDPETGKVL